MVPTSLELKINKAKLYMQKEVAEILSVSSDTVRRMRVSGKLKGYRVCEGHYRYLGEDVLKFLRRDTVINTTKN